MSTWRFRSTFCAVGIGLQRDPEAWERVIADPETDFGEDPSSVLILVDDHAQCSLLVEPVGERFAVSWEIRRAEPDESRAVIPCVDETSMEKFDRTAHYDPVPIGSLIDREVAAQLVRQFLEVPDRVPDHLEWRDRSDIDWPDD